LYNKILEKVQREASGINAKNIVSEIARYHRIQASPGFREAAVYCKRWFEENALDSVNMLEFPADGKQMYWSLKMPEAWSVKDAELRVVSPKRAERVLCRFRDVPLSLIQRSSRTPAEGIETELVVLEDGTEQMDYHGKDIKGKIVLTSGDLTRVKALAVDRYGAVGIVTDRMPEYPPIRDRMDVKDAVCYTSFWWRKDERKCFGFVLSPAEGEKLRVLVKDLERKKRLREKLEDDESGGVTVYAKVEAEFYDGTCEDVTAVIDGADQPEEEVLVVAHLCHPSPSANDNASGCAAAMESARCLRILISEGVLSRPKRTIRFLLVPEMTGTYAYLATHEEQLPNIIAAINLDMVGHDQEVTKAPLLVERTPEATPSFVNHLLARILKDLTKEAENLGGTERYASFKWAVTPYSGGSDHYILSDPTVGVPAPMIIHWPDLYYHTSQDTVDKVSSEELKRVIMMTSTYTYFLANAGYEESLWLANLVASEAKKRILETVQEGLSKVMAEPDEKERKKPERFERRIARNLMDLEEKFCYVLDREIKALRSVGRIVPGKEKDSFEVYLQSIEEDFRQSAAKELECAKETVKAYREAKGLGQLGMPKKRGLRKDENIAANMVPIRICRGPISISLALEKMTDEDRLNYWKMMSRKKRFQVSLDLAIYWTDGARNLLEISKLVKQEAGRVDLRFLIDYFRTLERGNLIKIKEASTHVS